MAYEEFKQELSAALEFYDVYGRRVPPTDHPYEGEAINDTIQHVNRAIVDIEHFSIAQPEWFRQADASARAFVGSLGFSALRQVVLFPENRRLHKQYALDGNTYAVTDQFAPVIFARYAKMQQLYAAGGQELVATLIAHELGHDTACPMDRIAVHDKGSWCQIEARSGFMTMGPDSDDGGGGSRGEFYEEGFAHYIAGWYRRSQWPDYDLRVIGITDPPHRDVPNYAALPFLTTAGPDGYAMELIAWGVEQRDIMTANKFVGLLLDSRRLGSRTTALRSIAQAIHRLRPGLYEDLHKLTYGSTNWHKGLDMVYDAVTTE